MFPILEKAGGDDDDIVTLQLFCHLFIQFDAKECVCQWHGLYTDAGASRPVQLIGRAKGT